MARAIPRWRRLTLVVAGAIVAAVFGVGIVAWTFFSSPLELGEQSASDVTASRGLPAQQSGESAVARRDPAGLSDPTGGRARAIKESAQPLTMTEAQMQAVQAVIQNQDVEPVEKINFELMIGAAIPEQTRLHDLPPRIAEIMNGYWGDRYLLAGDKLIIVDLHTRRVAAIVPGMQ